MYNTCVFHDIHMYSTFFIRPVFTGLVSSIKSKIFLEANFLGLSLEGDLFADRLSLILIPLIIWGTSLG